MTEEHNVTPEENKELAEEPSKKGKPYKSRRRRAAQTLGDVGLMSWEELVELEQELLDD